MKKTELEIKIEAWWDNLNDNQQNWLEDKFFEEDEHGINTLEKVVHCYNHLDRDELLTLSGMQED
jgi:hypothetical protein